jgi:hypothetical protein
MECEECMSTKIVFPCALVLAVLGSSALRAQDLSPTPTILNAPKPASAEDALPAPHADSGITQPAWITYTKAECCGPIGRNGPIQTELFIQSGGSIPIGGGVFPHVLETGWTIQGGGRSLFFNTDGDADWAISLSLANTNNHGQHSDVLVPIFNGGTEIAVSVREYNRTYAQAGIGRDWYLDSAKQFLGSCQLHIGLDGFGRFGTSSIEFTGIQHTTYVTGGLGNGLHVDLEYPCGGATFLLGLRGEWAYNWTSILQRQNDNDLVDINVLLTLGIRF